MNQPRFYRYEISGGCGSNKAYLRLNGRKATFLYRSSWMGMDVPKTFRLEGEYCQVSENDGVIYNLIKFKQPDKDQPVSYYCDLFEFKQPIDNCLGSSVVNEELNVPFGIYVANGCNFCVSIKALIILNHEDILDESSDKSLVPADILKNMKFEESNSESFEKFSKSIRMISNLEC